MAATADAAAGVLADAEQLVATGRALDAIDLLTERNRAGRDAAVERLLVSVRHRAFGQLRPSPGRATWPPAVDDPFPDDDGIPTIGPDRLSGPVLGGALQHHGCLRVDGLVAEQQVAHLVDLIDRAFDERDRANRGEPPPAPPTFAPFEPGRARAEGFGNEAFVRVVDVPAAAFELAELFAATPLLGAVTDHLAERPAMIANKWVLRRAPTGKIGVDFHQDGAFLGQGIRTVDCWIALSDCGPGTGRPAIDLVPRRFPLLEPGDGAAFSWSLNPTSVEQAMPDAPLASPTFRAGDALLFDELLPHRTSVGLDLTTRYAIESWFVAPSSYPARHVPVLL